MSRIKGFFIGFMFCALFHMWVFGWSEWAQQVVMKVEGVIYTLQDTDESALEEQLSNPLNEDEREQDDEWGHQEQTSPDNSDHIDTTLFIGEDAQIHMGMGKTEVEQVLGSPDRQEPSAYGYNWWVYNQDPDAYIQLGFEDDTLVTLYSNGTQWSWKGLRPGMPMESDDLKSFKKRTSFNHDLGFFSFELTDEEFEQKPLRLIDDMAIQVYIDIHDENRISGIRLMTQEVLLRHRPYSLTYTGQLPTPPDIDEETWQNIETAYERQIFDVTNVFRHRHQLPMLTWHDEVSLVAKGHSSDMYIEDFFDHVSPKHGDLQQRLQENEVAHRLAGENIAWNYVDGVDALEGWVNSLGHRENLLKESFESLGVGVVQKYYTQNFVTE
ncbi:CAP domain-containing protein [Caldalkalibacillus salinus]|uniref:CAP domain-containing protein n=1 Tax=Caldalkalibacillus salinus TaxID=2803787 RepID=UPI0019247119|nr:CAP domain-containing protein [Caldalkalibacillus salinus]